MSFDPKAVLDDVIQIIREDVEIIQGLTPAQIEANVCEYDDEFENDNTDWKFGAPAVFVRIVKGLPRFKYVDGGSDTYDYDIVIFICHNSSDAGNTHILDVVKQVRDALEGEKLDIGGEDLTIQTGQFDFFRKVNKMSVYTLDAGTIPNADIKKDS